MLPALLAPLLTSLAANGLGLLAGAIQAKGKEVIEDKLGIKIPAEASKLTPELLSQLKIKEIDHEEFLIDARMEELKIGIEDTKDARLREVAIATSEAAPLLNKIITPVLAIGVLSLTFLIFIFMIFSSAELEPSKKDLLVYILGVLSAIATQIVAYYFGSSTGSKEKSITLAGLEKRHESKN